MLSLEAPVKSIVPEVSSGYAEATVQQVLDMVVTNNFSEGYDDNAYSPEPPAGSKMGYSRQEISMGWRLAPIGEARPRTMQDFISRIELTEDSDSGYKSTNNDLLGWIAEKVTGQSLRELLSAVVAGAGLEGSFHCGCDASFFPICSGAGFMTARDLCRYVPVHQAAAHPHIAIAIRKH
jgi:CubicO group peptidase (beta-lactamase class C family)